nr:MAG TPA_asm: hypothetical protein [Caudoviricetes sp.]
MVVILITMQININLMVRAYISLMTADSIGVLVLGQVALMQIIFVLALLMQVKLEFLIVLTLISHGTKKAL